MGERGHCGVALVFESRGFVELGAEVGTERDEGVEGELVADDPGGDGGEGAEGC